MGLHGDGLCHDRGGDPQFRGGAVTGVDFRHHAEMVTRRRLERWRTEVYYLADGGVVTGLYRQYRPYHAWLDD
ncbi:hypothetical protein D3C75_1077400 [compost metagenome]